ncbi:hypothetical protein BO94DRAFT_537821 [Aspergillus sclerotioniger CBS 115572]|uniref:Uncharacterized protein n=1 Tax=Aspergillus sclerotioniger CBS 115572 TaxID=1450535 RepID=A0A317VUH8_9EURO|nr:hypothetical protein BO94DRAFT_537821 [Aspergillus sclerotioniger CBS 115572]PWY78044.1 hypothetical protein BO94DRAFT_537821 [Aspergillus sclerotioniger CBS 115572]
MSRSPFRPSTPATMNAADKQNTGHLGKPLTPALSAAFHRSQKAPLTPRLATPGGYRTPKRLTPSEHPSSAPSKRDPEPSLLSANVTPRSGSRTSRRDGSVTSPNNTPANGQQSPQVSWAQPHVGQVSSTGRLRTERSPVRGGMLEPARTTRARTVTMESNHLSRPNSSSDNSSGAPMFFHASDARSTSSEQEPRPKLQSKPSATTFIYANGTQERPTAVSELGGTTYKRRSIGLTRSVVSAKPSASPRLRPARVDSNPRLSDGPSQVGSQLDDSFETGSQGHSPPLSSVSARPIPAVRHIKSSSLDSASSGLSPPQREGLRPSPLIISPSEARLDASNIASEPLPGLRPRVFSNGSITSVDTHNSGMQSPSKSESGQGNPGVALNNARTERKIMDLEISNSSLLAINRTLEREMRKQNTELRRYRRLSRSGRLSMAASNRSVSDALSIPTEIIEGSEHSSVRSAEELSDFSDEESVDDGVISPDSQGDQDTQHRAQDEKRFLVDLAKHQELLADSQRMNQSLKRCLGWTEELIKEAQRALEYNVHVNDVQLGGRVLNPEELNELELHELRELEDLSRPSSPSSSDTPSEGELSS